jgi:phage terminase Nu1 subunit (DNA packaging protein)
MASANVDQVATALNITPRRVQQLVKEGMPQAARGQYDLGVCMHWFIRFLQQAVQRRSTSDGESMHSLTSERIRQAGQSADKQALENAVRRGELVSAPYVVEVMRGMAADISGRLDGIPGRLATELVGFNAEQIKIRLLAEVRGIRSGVAEYVRRLAEPARGGATKRRRSVATSGGKNA